MTADIYRNGAKFLDVADETHRQYLDEPESDDGVDYSNGKPVAYHKHDPGRVVRTPLDGTTRIGVIGESGSGKTVGIKRYVSVAYDDGYAIMNGADAKNDFQDINRDSGISKNLRNEMDAELLDGERPHPVPVEMMQPLLLANMYEKTCNECDMDFRQDASCPRCQSQNYRGGRPAYINAFSLRFSDLNKAEFQELVNVDGRQSEVLGQLIEDIGLYNTTFTAYMEALDRLKEEGDVPLGAISSLKSTLRSLENRQVLNNRTNPLSRVFQQLGESVVSLSIRNREELPDGSEFDKVVDLYIVKAMQEWIRRIRKGELQGEDNLWIGDECHEFIPAGTNSKLLRVIGRMIHRDARQADMAMIFSTQQPSQLPNAESRDDENILGSLTHCFIGKSRTALDESEWKTVLRSMNVYRGDRSELNRWRDKFARMDQHDFIYINSEDHMYAADCPIVQFFPPKCAHTG